MPQAMKIPAAKAAVDKEWDNWRKISAWNLTKVKSKKRVIDESKDVGRLQFIFASLIDMCHLKNAELEAKNTKSTKGRVVLRGDIVKDNSGYLMQYSLNKDLQHLK